MIPVYVITGFLDSGKTSFLDALLQKEEFQKKRFLLVQFESGEIKFTNKNQNCDLISISKKVLDQDLNQAIEQISTYLKENNPDEIWIEWNGVASFSQLQEILLNDRLHSKVKLQKVFHLADAEAVQNLLGRTGLALPEQIAASDFIVIRNASSTKELKLAKRSVREMNPGVKVFQLEEEASKIERQIYRKKIHIMNQFLFGVLAFIALYLFSTSVLNISETPVNVIIQVFLGILLQAVPFLLIGVLISSLIQVFVSPELIKKWFPKNPLLGMVAAILAGFLLPVCDCATIPIFRSLVKKGVPLPVAITFMVVTPVINPVVMLSTYYAFNGNMVIVYMRVIFGILVSLAIGTFYFLWPTKGDFYSGGQDSLLCSCGCYDGLESSSGIMGKIRLFIQHSQVEFFDVGKYLILGAFAAAFFQTTIVKHFSIHGNARFVYALLFMMIMAFLLSLCSSSDAVIARSFASNIPSGAIMGFMVFGPMMDVKNVIMLSGSFSKKFIAKLLIISFVMCFAILALIL